MREHRNALARLEIAWTYEHERGVGVCVEVTRKRCAEQARRIRSRRPEPPPARDERLCAHGRLHTGSCSCDSDG